MSKLDNRAVGSVILLQYRGPNVMDLLEKGINGANHGFQAGRSFRLVNWGQLLRVAGDNYYTICRQGSKRQDRMTHIHL